MNIHTRLGDLTVEQYLALTQGWSTGVWLIMMALTVGGAYLWRRWRAARLAKVMAAEPAMPPSLRFGAEECAEDCPFVLADDGPAGCQLSKGHGGAHYVTISWQGVEPPRVEAVGNLNDNLKGGC